MPIQQGKDIRRIGTILLVGMVAGAGVRYIAAKAAERAAADPQSRTLIDWDLARKVALRVSQTDEHPAQDRALREAQYRRMVERSEPLIERYMNSRLPEPFSRVKVMDRREWLEANFESFKHILDPIEDLYQDIAHRHPTSSTMRMLNRQAVGMQVGVLLGYLARRVLGQYDLSLFSPNPDVSGALYFLEPNISAVQKQLGVDDEDFRLWITLHETSHVFQFESFPWVRGYFHELLGQFMGQVSNQLDSLSGGVNILLDRIMGRQSGDHWMETLMTQEQRQVFDKLQALMSLVEGYSNHIMNAIGSEMLPSFEQIENRFKQRQKNRTLFEELFNRITGMDLKLAQYRQGEEFVDAVVAQRDIAFMNRVWEKPDHLPTMDEIRNPARWITRMSAVI